MNKLQKFIRTSETRWDLVREYPEGSEVTMEEIEAAYERLSRSPKSNEVKRARGRHVYLRLVDEGYWKGDLSQWVKVEQMDGIFYWSRIGTLRVDDGVKVKTKVLRFETVSGKYQSIGIQHINNLAELMQHYVKAENS